MAYNRQQIESMLQIDKHRLDDCLEQQAQITYEISGLLSTANTRMVWCKEDLDKIEAELYLELRHQEGSKCTENEIRAEQQTDKKRVASYAVYQDAKREYEKLMGLMESWKARGFALTTLANLAMANYYATDSVGKDKGYTSARQTLATARQQSEDKPRRRVLV